MIKCYIKKVGYCLSTKTGIAYMKLNIIFVLNRKNQG